MMLRPYQQHAVHMTLDLWAQGVRAVLFVCPTGGGKTHVFAELARLEARRAGRTLVLADRKRLIDQAADRCRAAGLSVGFEQAARRVGARAPRVVCATIQSIGRPARLRRFKPGSFSLIIVDEADLGIAPSYLSVLAHFPGARVFGGTATPDRADRRSLGEVFEDVAARVEMADLIRAGYLSPLRRHLVRIESVTLEKVPRPGGDFTDAALEKVLVQERPLHEVARPALEAAGDRSTIVFGASVKHAEELAAVLNRYRPGCARSIHGETDDAERAELLAAFERREFQFLCNCALLLRGVDLPFVSCVVMARPTLSRALYAQALGRGTRLAPGKADLLVLDFTDNSAVHDLCSPIDVLAPSAAPEVRERARELLDSEQGADPLEVLGRAEVQLETDPVLREQVRARVAFKERYIGGPKGIDWSKQPLGKIPDSAIALTLGCHQAAVTAARKGLGIPRCPARNYSGIDWDAQPLGKEPDSTLAARLGLSAEAVSFARRRCGIPAWSRTVAWDDQPLGRETDAKIALRLRVGIGAVSAARRARGIPSMSNSKDIDWRAQPLGHESDGSIAERLGCSKTAVCAARKRLGIPAYRPAKTGR